MLTMRRDRRGSKHRKFDEVVEVLNGVTPRDRVVATGAILLKQTTQ